MAAGLFVFGFGNGTWDVAMNVQGAAVERELGRAIMPRFHAGWSIGTVAGAGIGAVMVALGVPVTAHLLAAALAVAVAVPVAARRFLPARPRRRRTADGDGGQAPPAGGVDRAADPADRPVRAVHGASPREPATTGSASAVIDGYHTAAVLGTLTFAVFLAAMTTGRWFGPALHRPLRPGAGAAGLRRHRPGRPAR